MKRKVSNTLYYVIIFVGLFAFFYLAHPMIIFNTDDWHFASYWRRPLPIPGGYNGIKVFPETFMALVSEIGLYTVYPILKDYLMSLAFAYAVTLSLFILVFVYLIEKFLDHFVSDNLVSKGISFLVLIFHFLIYKNDWLQNHHLFYAQDVTCVFHYTLSALLNLCIVMYLLSVEVVENRSISKDIAQGRYSLGKAGALIFAIYLSIFSSMFHNIILASFCGVSLLLALVKDIKNMRFKLADFCGMNWLHLVTILAWLSTLVMQVMDPRNGDAKKQEMKAGLGNAVSAFIGQIAGINKFLMLFVGIIVIVVIVKAIAGARSNKSKKNVAVLDDECARAYLYLILSGIITTIYLVILASVAGRDYISREDVLIGIFDYGFAIFALMLVRLLTTRDKSANKGVIVLPLLIFLLTSQTLNYCKSYADYNIFGLSWEETYAAGSDIIEQVKAAEDDGLEEFDLYVTDNESWNNIWPYTDYVGTTISDTLYRHGIIKKPMKATAVYDAGKNKELNITY